MVRAVTGGYETYVLTDDERETASYVYRIFRNDWTIFEKVINQPPRWIADNTVNVRCPQCAADMGVPCVTVTGNRARETHESRFIALLGVLLAIANNPIIEEETDIDDCLVQSPHAHADR